MLIERPWVIVRRTSLQVFIATALLAGSTSFAEQYVTQAVGDWTVAAARDRQGCLMSREYDGKGGTVVLMGLGRNGTNYLSVLNANWSIKGDRLTLDFRISSGAYSGHAVVGMEPKGKRGFVTDFEPKFPAYLAASTFLRIDRGDVPVARLDLDGSGAAIAELRRCVGVSGKGAVAEPDKDKRSGDVPTDPFADTRPRRR